MASKDSSSSAAVIGPPPEFPPMPASPLADRQGSDKPQQQHQQASSPTVALFQKAHQKLVGIQRIDDQLATLAEHRRKLQEELRLLKEQINDEFDRILEQEGEGASRTLGQIAAEGARARIKIAE